MIIHPNAADRRRMRSQMKKPILRGIGQRNDTVEATRQARVLQLAADEVSARLAAARPQPAPMTVGQRMLNYWAATGGRQPTPAQLRRGRKKERRNGSTAWPRPGLDTLSALDEHKLLIDEHEQKMLEPQEDDGPELPQWDPAECSCHINPPCAYCEHGEYVL